MQARADAMRGLSVGPSGHRRRDQGFPTPLDAQQRPSSGGGVYQHQLFADGESLLSSTGATIRSAQATRDRRSPLRNSPRTPKVSKWRNM